MSRVSQAGWAAEKFHWVPDSPVSTLLKTCVDVSSPSVCQLIHVGNRLSHSLTAIVSSPCTSLVILCCSFLVTSQLRSSASLTPRIPSHTHCYWENFLLNTRLPSCHHCSQDFLEPRVVISLCSAHLEFHLLLLKYLWLHLQHKLFPLLRSTFTWRSSMITLTSFSLSVQCNNLYYLPRLSPPH